eukprot:1949943-Rhodomonas_salina.1
MGEVRKNSPGNKATALLRHASEVGVSVPADYMSSLGGGGPASSDDSSPGADSEAARIAERARKMLEERDGQ